MDSLAQQKVHRFENFFRFLGLVALLILNNAGRRSVSDTSAIGNLLVNKRHGVFRATLSLLNEARLLLLFVS